MPETPFFIVGHPRSGTTLLRFMLSSHSRLYIPEETGFLPFLKLSPEKPLTRSEIQSLLERIANLNYLWRDLPITADQIMAAHQPPTLPRVLDELYGCQAVSHHAVRWGDKTPLYVQYLPDIQKIFPQAQFIHMIRDGRDAALSALKKWGGNTIYMDIYYLLKNWVRNVTTGREYGHRMQAGRYLEVRYEDLVTSPPTVLRQVCSFLNESFESSMLDHTAAAHQAGPGPMGHYEALLPVFKDSRYRWKVEMSPFQRKLSAQVAGELLLELGYELPEEKPMLPRETVMSLALAARFMIFDTLRTILYRTGFLTLNRSMRVPKADCR